MNSIASGLFMIVLAAVGGLGILSEAANGVSPVARGLIGLACVVLAGYGVAFIISGAAKGNGQ